MVNTIVASVALLATTALAQWGGSSGGGVGSAIVINQCSYDVYVHNTPSDDGVHKEDDQTLSTGGTYSQPYTQLTNNNGWSIKLSKDQDAYSSNILQYEYTYHPGEPIWFDLSEVNGNPWDGNWEITATGGCTPRQAAYRYATDDAYGMQSCDASASITVTLCSGDAGGAAPSSPSESAPPAGPTSYPAPSVPATAPTSAAPPAASNTWYGGPPGAAKNAEAPAGDAVPEKELPTPADDGWNGPATTVTNIHYATVTETVVATAHPKRHVHHPRHPHHRR